MFTQSNMPDNSTIPIYRDYEYNQNNCLYSSEKTSFFIQTPSLHICLNSKEIAY